jgi:hypothetical protein
MSESVRSLLTTAERKLLESSVGSSMEKATEKMLKTAVRRARELRDKWLDKFARQNRTTKRGRGGAVKGHLGTVATPSTSNVRSREKAELFDGALRRFEERLRILLEPVRPAETGAAKRSRAKASKPRAGSGIVRGVGGAKTKRPSRPDAAAATGQVAARANASKAVKPRSSKALDVTTLGSRSAAASGQRVRADAAGQRSAKAAARKAREKLQGLAIHRNAHAAARVRRAQARRDGR